MREKERRKVTTAQLLIEVLQSCVVTMLNKVDQDPVAQVRLVCNRLATTGHETALGSGRKRRVI